MFWLMIGGFLVALALIAGIFLIDNKSFRNDRDSNCEQSGILTKPSGKSQVLDMSGDIVNKLSKHIEKGDYEIVDNVVDQLEKFPPEKQSLIRLDTADPVIVNRYKAGIGDKDYKVRALSAERLGKIGAEGVSLVLFEAMADKHEEVRLAATTALKKIKDPSVAGMLIDALKFPNKWLPARIAEVLISLGEKAIAALKAALGDPDPVIRAYVVELLGEMGPTLTVETLYPALKDEHSGVRLQAARVLGKLGLADSIRILVDLLNDPEIKVQIQAIRSMGRIGGAEAAKHLEKILNSDRDQIIQLAALESLRLMDQGGIMVLERVAAKEGHPLAEKARGFLAEVNNNLDKKVNINYI